MRCATHAPCTALGPARPPFAGRRLRRVALRLWCPATSAENLRAELITASVESQVIGAIEVSRCGLQPALDALGRNQQEPDAPATAKRDEVRTLVFSHSRELALADSDPVFARRIAQDLCDDGRRKISAPPGGETHPQDADGKPDDGCRQRDEPARTRPREVPEAGRWDQACTQSVQRYRPAPEVRDDLPMRAEGLGLERGCQSAPVFERAHQEAVRAPCGHQLIAWDPRLDQLGDVNDALPLAVVHLEPVDGAALNGSFSQWRHG